MGEAVDILMYILGNSVHRGGVIDQSPMRRLANKTERDLLVILQDCQCAICQADLADGFEVDHMTPFSRGGATALSNLQALCPSCHLEKTREQAKRKSLPGH